MNSNTEEHKCDKIELNNGVVTLPPTIEEVKECRDGCCTDYKCKVCGRQFRIEWPD